MTNRPLLGVGSLFKIVIRSFKEFEDFDNERLADIWNIFIMEEPPENQDVLDKQNVLGLLDMLYDDYLSKHPQNQRESSEPRNYSNSDVLDILRTIHRECFRTVPNYEVKLNEIDKGRLELNSK